MGDQNTGRYQPTADEYEDALKEIERLSAEVEEANRRAEYWKAEHNAANVEIDALRAQRYELLAALESIAKDATSTYEDAWCGDIAREAIDAAMKGHDENTSGG